MTVQLKINFYSISTFCRSSNPEESKSCTRMPRTGAADLARVLHKLLPECSGEYAYDKIKITNILLDILVLMLDLAEYVKLRAFFF